MSFLLMEDFVGFLNSKLDCIQLDLITLRNISSTIFEKKIETAGHPGSNTLHYKNVLVRTDLYNYSII